MPLVGTTVITVTPNRVVVSRRAFVTSVPNVMFPASRTSWTCERTSEVRDLGGTDENVLNMMDKTE